MRHKKVLRGLSVLLASVLVLQGALVVPTAVDAAKKATLKQKSVTLVVGKKTTVKIKNKVKKNKYKFTSSKRKSQELTKQE